MDVVCEEEQLFSILVEEITAPIGVDLQSNKVYDTAVTGYTDRHLMTPVSRTHSLQPVRQSG